MRFRRFLNLGGIASCSVGCLLALIAIVKGKHARTLQSVTYIENLAGKLTHKSRILRCQAPLSTPPPTLGKDIAIVRLVFNLELQNSSIFYPLLPCSWPSRGAYGLQSLFLVTSQMTKLS